MLSDHCQKCNVTLTGENTLKPYLTRFDCFYCDSKSTVLAPNGLDRVLNGVGYQPDNVVPCCKNCNFAKNASSVSVFVSRCKKIADNFISGGGL